MIVGMEVGGLGWDGVRGVEFSRCVFWDVWIWGVVGLGLVGAGLVELGWCWGSLVGWITNDLRWITVRLRWITNGLRWITNAPGKLDPYLRHS